MHNEGLNRSDNDILINYYNGNSRLGETAHTSTVNSIVYYLE